MPVTISRTADTATVTVTVSVAAIRQNDALTRRQKEEETLRLAQSEIGLSMQMITRTDAEIDAEIDKLRQDLDALRAVRKAAKPTGSF